MSVRVGVTGLRMAPLLMLTAALVLSMVVAFTAVSIGIAQAGTLMPFGGGGVGGSRSPCWCIVIAGMGGLTAAFVHDDKFPPRRD